MIINVSAGFCDIVMRMKLLMMESVPLGLIIIDPTRIELRMKVDKYQTAVEV